MPCEKVEEEVCQQIEERAGAGISPRIDEMSEALKRTLSAEQRKLLVEIEDLYAQLGGRMISEALNHGGCSK